MCCAQTADQEPNVCVERDLNIFSKNAFPKYKYYVKNLIAKTTFVVCVHEYTYTLPS